MQDTGFSYPLFPLSWHFTEVLPRGCRMAAGTSSFVFSREKEVGVGQHCLLLLWLAPFVREGKLFQRLPNSCPSLWPDWSHDLPPQQSLWKGSRRALIGTAQLGLRGQSANPVVSEPLWVGGPLKAKQFS